MEKTVSRKKAKILTGNRKSHYPIDTLFVMFFQISFSDCKCAFSIGELSQDLKNKLIKVP